MSRSRIAFCVSIVVLVGASSELWAGIPDDDSLVLYLEFEEGGGDIAMDSSQHAFEARLEGDYEWVAQGRNGGGVEFEAGRAVAPDDAILEVEQLTAMAWVFPTEIWGEQQCHNWGNMIYQKSGASDDSVEFVLLGGDGACLYINSGPGGNDRMGPFNGADVDNSLVLPDLGIPENAWTHLATTFSGEVLALYVNGELAGEKDIGGANPSIVMNDNENSIGGRDHNASWFVGIMDEFAMFNRPLGEQEIRRWMDQAFAVDPRGQLATMWGRVKAQ
jgi:hypothetical protein